MFCAISLCLVSLMIDGCMSRKKRIELFTIQLSSDDVSIRRTAVIELAQMGKLATIPALIQALGDSDEQVYELAIDALVEMGELAMLALIEALNSENDAMYHHAATMLI